ncbi:hypothetical protein [Paraburkholderia sp. J7]|uniref:hypothetical protein n=1 Tax=Paraburkholderia sp. J7 TaxID=2805438 RepID=UPI002AB6A092|nr:hypothetical protein [Paraburkholderia sp. J7]
MGANFFFDKLLPAADTEARKVPGSQRQVEIFTHGDGLWLRVGLLDEEHQGQGFTVEFTKSAAAELAEGLDRAMHYFGYKK